MNYDDETLMAYADGELDAAQRAEIDAAIARRPGARAPRANSIARCAPKTGAAHSRRCSTSRVPERLEAAARGGAAAR